MDIEHPPTYTTLKSHKKKRRVRRFGAITFTNKRKEVKQIRPAEYMFIKNEPKTVHAFKITEFVNMKRKNNGTKIL